MRNSLVCLLLLLCLWSWSTPLAAQTPPATVESQSLPSIERRPIPDPTTLTTAAVREAIIALKDVIYTRLDAMDKALQLLQTRSDKLPQDIADRIATIRDLVTERFKGVELQFEGIALQFRERDTRVEQTARDSKTAVDAALQAAKEAVEKQNFASSQAATKSELAFTKQIDQLAELFRTGTKSLEDKIASSNKVSDDKLTVLNDRITRLESGLLGQRTAQGDSKDNTMLILAIIAAVIGVAGFAYGTMRSPRP